MNEGNRWQWKFAVVNPSVCMDIQLVLPRLAGETKLDLDQKPTKLVNNHVKHTQPCFHKSITWITRYRGAAEHMHRFVSRSSNVVQVAPGESPDKTLCSATRE